MTLIFHIDNTQTSRTRVGLGVTLTDPSGRAWNDRADDVSNAQISAHTYTTATRIFDSNTFVNQYGNMPIHLNPTPFQMTCAIWDGQPGYSNWLDSVTITVYLNNPYTTS